MTSNVSLGGVLRITYRHNFSLKKWHEILNHAQFSLGEISHLNWVTYVSGLLLTTVSGSTWNLEYVSSLITCGTEINVVVKS